MRDFMKRGGLKSLPWDSKAIYTAYLLFSLAAYVVIAVLVIQRTGVTPADYAEYYQGNEENPPANFADIKYAKTEGELLETTHFHLFSYPLYLLVQGHLFLMTALPRPFKVSVVLSAFTGAFLYLLAPWLVFWFGSNWGWVSQPARLLLGIPLVLFLAVPLWEMWGPRKY